MKHGEIYNCKQISKDNNKYVKLFLKKVVYNTRDLTRAL